MPREDSRALFQAFGELTSLCRLLDENRVGASREWVAAAERAVARAEDRLREAGGEPRPRPARRADGVWLH